MRPAPLAAEPPQQAHLAHVESAAGELPIFPAPFCGVSNVTHVTLHALSQSANRTCLQQRGCYDRVSGGVGRLLGALPLELSLGAVLSGVDVLTTLLPALAEGLASWGMPPDAASRGCVHSVQQELTATLQQLPSSHSSYILSRS